jgi:hypothetical protein
MPCDIAIRVRSRPLLDMRAHAVSPSLRVQSVFSLISLTLDFDSNKKVTEEVALLPSKRIRNKIAGYVTVRACNVTLFM